MNVGMAGFTDSEGGLDTFFQDLSSSTALVKVNGAGAKKKGAAPATAKKHSGREQERKLDYHKSDREARMERKWMLMVLMMGWVS
jgi:hypothetical protein